MRSEKLLNRKIKNAYTKPGNEEFVIEFEDGIQRFQVQGDCCSQSWIEHFTVPNDVDGATLLSVEESGGTEEKHPDHECLLVYETRFRTNRGDIVLEYRNSSNGYYCGYIEMVDEQGRIIYD
jgi:hypothetical protein